VALTGTSGPLEHLARVARAIEWLFVRVGLAVLAIGVAAFLVLVPPLAELGAWGGLVALLLGLVVVGPPVRVARYGRRLGAAFGDPARVHDVLLAVPGAITDMRSRLAAIEAPRGRGVRRLVTAWRALRQVRTAFRAVPLRERGEELVHPVDPQVLARTLTSLWLCLLIAVVGSLTVLSWLGGQLAG
jgi:hypothetical protein